MPVYRTVRGKRVEFPVEQGGLGKSRSLLDWALAVSAGSEYSYSPQDITTLAEFQTAVADAQANNNGVLNLTAGTFTIDITPPYSPDTEAAIVVDDGETLVIEGAGQGETILNVTPADLTGLAAAAKLFYVKPGGTFAMRDMTCNGPQNSLGNSTPHDGTTGYITNRFIEQAGRGEIILDNVRLAFWGEPLKSTFTEYADATTLYSAWAAATTYGMGDRVVSSGNVYECRQGGVSHASTGPSAAGNAGEISDGTVYWIYVASSTNFQIGGTNVIHNCDWNNRGHILVGQGTNAAGWDRASSVLVVTDTKFEHMSDYMNTAADATGIGHQIYAGPGCNLMVSNSRFENCGHSNRAIQINDSDGDDCYALYCQISNSWFAASCKSGVENNQYVDTTIDGCTFETYSDGVRLRSSGGSVNITGCTFQPTGAGGQAITYGANADVAVNITGCGFYNYYATIAGNLPAFIDLSSGASRTQPWYITNCHFGGSAEGSCASRSTGDVGGLRVTYAYCSFDTMKTAKAVYITSGKYRFHHCDFLSTKAIDVFNYREDEAAEVELVGCTAVASNDLLVVAAPATYTCTITGHDNEWASGEGPDIANDADIKGYLRPKGKLGSNIASSGTITLTNSEDTYHVTGTTQIDTINFTGTTAPNRAFAGPVRLIADAAWSTSAAGNIVPASTAARSANDVVVLYFDQTNQKWVEESAGEISLAAVGSSPNANGATLTGGVLNLEPAEDGNPGILTNLTQTIGGRKEFYDNIKIVAESGEERGVTFRAEGDIGTENDVEWQLGRIVAAGVGQSTMRWIHSDDNDYPSEHVTMSWESTGTLATIGNFEGGVSYYEAFSGDGAINPHFRLNGYGAGNNELTFQMGPLATKQAVGTMSKEAGPGGDLVTVTTPHDHNLTTGDQIYVSAATDDPKFGNNNVDSAGPWAITVTGATTYTYEDTFSSKDNAGGGAVTNDQIHYLSTEPDIMFRRTDGNELTVIVGGTDVMTIDKTSVELGSSVTFKASTITAVDEVFQNDGDAPCVFKGWQGDSGGAVAFRLESGQALSTNGAKLAQFRNTTNEKFAIGYNGEFYGNVGTDASAGDAATINSPFGTFVKDTTGTAFTLTNSHITATSLVFAVVQTSGVSSYVTEVIPGAGSATINFSAAPSSDATVAFMVVKPI